MMNGERLRLLVVDDEADFTGFVRDFAGRFGYDVATAENGAVARERFREFDPHVVLLDMIMPQMDGVEFIEWLGSERANVRLVVVTGFNPNYGRLAEKLAEARGLSSVVVLTKPVRVATLHRALRGDVD
jgi:CheY-like chemotaxis protein